MTQSSQKKHYFGSILNRRFWLIWFLALLIIFIVHCLTLTILPIPWRDEAQIIEYGRLVLEPTSNWSINWLLTSDQPFFLLSYLGATLQELAFRATNLSLIGPRLMSLVGSMISATFLLAWLLESQIPKKIALLLSIIFLLDPIFVQSYRSDRVDCWVFVFCFACCWLLRRARNNISIQNIKKFLPHISLSGSLATIAFFIWPSAILLYPLIILELIEILRKNKIYRQWNYVFLIIINFAVFGIVTLMILILPILNRIDTIFINFKIVSRQDLLQDNLGWAIRVVSNIKNLLHSFKMSPFILLFTGIAIGVYRKEKKIIFITILVLSFIISTRVYVFRSIYLLPYMILLICSIYINSNSPKLDYYIFRQRAKWLKVSILSILLAWSVILSMFLRPAIGLSQKEARNPNILMDKALELDIGKTKVFIDSWDFYSVGRSLGWQMYHPIENRYAMSKLSEEDLKLFLSKFDYALLNKKSSSFNLYINTIETRGFKYENQSSKISGNKFYGPYLLLKFMS